MFTGHSQQITITRLWDGSPALLGEHVTLELVAAPERRCLQIAIDAPFHGDPPPPGPPGHTPGLWNFEVVELFLFGDGARYLELEFGPHGHHLVLELHGVRTPVREVSRLAYRSERFGDRWRGAADVPFTLLPPGLSRCNAHAIHGLGDARRYLSAIPAGGDRPDFHRLDAAAALDIELLQALGRPPSPRPSC
ncbi:MAG TPA: hypothetical protein VIK91_11835 [Nannocystis sp.]